MERVRSASMGLTGGPATASGRGAVRSEALPAVKDDANDVTMHTIVNAAATNRRRCTGVRRLGAGKYTPAPLPWGIHFGASRARRACFGLETCLRLSPHVDRLGSPFPQRNRKAVDRVPAPPA